MQNLKQLANCYKLLAACFYEVDKDLFIEERVCENLAALLKDFSASAEAAAHKMQAFLQEESTEQLLVDYAQLFVGPFELLAPPYGSVYLEGNKQVMGESTLAVSKKYQEAGLEVNIKEPPDHIAFELEFLHYLSVLEAEADESGELEKKQTLAQERKEFLDTFVAPWVPLFCENIRNGATNPFYKSLADCLQNTIECVASDPTYSLPHAPAEKAAPHLQSEG